MSKFKDLTKCDNMALKVVGASYAIPCEECEKVSAVDRCKHCNSTILSHVQIVPLWFVYMQIYDADLCC